MQLVIKSNSLMFVLHDNRMVHQVNKIKNSLAEDLKKKYVFFFIFKIWVMIATSYRLWKDIRYVWLIQVNLFVLN